MKIPAILTCLLAVFLASVPVKNARADDVSFDVFYNNLADDGDWYNTPEYGYVWQPSIAYKNDKWRPYSDGYWAQTDDGWTWVSYENFGWAVYHYGRWTRLKDTGWVWVPGYDWGPGWVSWRTSDDYVGWAPLPPKVQQGVYEGRVVDRAPATTIDYNDVEPEDYGADTDVQYDIGPENYCFVDTHNFGAPVLGEVLLPPQRNVVIIERTTNVTNIFRRRDQDRFVIYNHGPDFNFISAHSERPIQQLRLERHDDLGFLRNGLHGGGNANQVRNGVFTVAAPPVMRGPIDFARVKPSRVKQTLERTEIVHGWSNSGADPATVQRLHEQFKQQAQQAPPPRREAADVAPRGNAPAPERAASNLPPAPAVGVPPVRPPNAGLHQPLTDAEKAARRDAAVRARDARANGQPAPVPVQPATGPAHAERPNGAPAVPATAEAPANGQPLTPEERKARRAARQQDRTQQPVPAAQSQAPQPPQAAEAPAPNPEREARRAQRQQERAAQPAPAPQAPQAAETPASNPAREARRAQRQQENAQPAPAAAAPQPEAQPAAPNPEREARRAQRQQERAAETAAPAAPAPAAPNPEREARRAERQQELPAPARPAQPPQAPNPEREARRAERQQEQAAHAPQPEPAHRPASPTPDAKKPGQ